MTTTLAFLFVLGVLIFVHELGHFLMARRVGVRVLTFSLGFGPKLLAFKRGDTEYAISAIPLGGYVKMAGENPEDARTGANDEFLSKTKWQRFQVLIMGPVMNILLALVVMAFVRYQPAQVAVFEGAPPVIGSLEPNSPAVAAGLQPGDLVLAVDGVRVDSWETFSMEILGKPNRTVKLMVERDGRIVDLEIVPTAVGRYEMGTIGARPRMHPQIIEVNPGTPAQEAGLQPDDIIVAAAGEKDIVYERVLEVIRSHDGKPLTFSIIRNGQPLEITVTPRRMRIDPSKDEEAVRIGATIRPFEVYLRSPGPLEAVQLSIQQNWDWTKLIVRTLIGLFTRETSVKQLMGPVAIADLSGSAAQAGLIHLFTLMAMISLNLGLLNLMPIPVLDGGHIAILALEGLARRDFSMKVKEKMLLAGFVLLLMLMVTVIYNDLARVQWIQRLMPWR